MKRGVLALQLRYNFGGILQAYALQKTLKELGHDAVHIDQCKYVSLGPWYKKYPIYLKRAIRKHLGCEDILVRADVAINNDSKIISTHTEPFIEKYIKRIFTKDFSNIKESDFDAFVVGSDQVWRTKYFFSKTENAYLDFAKDWDIKRIAYAASFGTEEWEYNEELTLNCSNLVKKFNAISVRESSAVELCKEKLGVYAQHVLDPTMLLKKEDYISLFEQANIDKSDGNLFCYILDKKGEKDDIVNNIAKMLQLTPFYVNSRYQDSNAPLEERIQQPVEKWLRAFHDAEFVITDSFHACVFSLLFNKPFIVYGNKDRGLTRLYSLLEMFGLEDRLATSLEDIEKILLTAIDWKNVNKTHAEWKEKSISFLTNSLK